MIDGIEIRGATPGDLDQVVDLLASQLAEHHMPIERADLAYAAEGILRVAERGFILLAVAREGAVGVACCSFSWTVERGGRVAWLDELYVAPARREHGIGNELLGQVIATAAAAGCPTVELEVEASHARGRMDRRRRWPCLVPAHPFCYVGTVEGYALTFATRGPG